MYCSIKDLNWVILVRKMKLLHYCMKTLDARRRASSSGISGEDSGAEQDYTIYLSRFPRCPRKARAPSRGVPEDSKPMGKNLLLDPLRMERGGHGTPYPT